MRTSEQIKAEIKVIAFARRLEICVRSRDTLARLEADDFGTGYSSLSYLHDFPISVLKIDRSFINQIDTSSKNVEIVSAIITLAHNLGIDVTSEGIETLEQLELLQKLQCKYGQGYLFSKPVQADAVEGLINKKIKLTSSYVSRQGLSKAIHISEESK